MQIVTDSGTDVSFTPLQMKEYNVHVVPLTVTLGGKSYREGIDIKPDEFYDLLDAADGMPVTSQPAAGEFALVYRELAKKDPDILSIHISSGLSGTVNSAIAGAAMVPEANVTVIDTKTLSVPSGWQVEAAARAVKAGWEPQRVLDLVNRIGSGTNVLVGDRGFRGLVIRVRCERVTYRAYETARDGKDVRFPDLFATDVRVEAGA